MLLYQVYSGSESPILLRKWCDVHLRRCNIHSHHRRFELPTYNGNLFIQHRPHTWPSRPQQHSYLGINFQQVTTVHKTEKRAFGFFLWVKLFESSPCSYFKKGFPFINPVYSVCTCFIETVHFSWSWRQTNSI